MRDTAHRFARDVLRPAGIKVDRMSPDDAIAPESPLWTALKGYRDIGLNLTEVAEGVTPVELAA